MNPLAETQLEAENVINYLIRKGADPNAQDQYGQVDSVDTFLRISLRTLDRSPLRRHARQYCCRQRAA